MVTPLAIIAIAGTGGSAPAFSADQTETGAQAGGATIQEVFVTARKQEESLQAVPLSITAFTEDAIEQVNPKTLADLNNLAPGLNWQAVTKRDGQGRVFFRGTSGTTPAPKAQLFMDGVYINGNASNISFSEIERVEVLPGPQSAQFGRSTFAGAVNYITKDPTDEFKGHVSANYANIGDQEQSLSLSGPLIPGKLFGSLSGSYAQFNSPDSWVAKDGTTKLAEFETKSVNGKLVYKPTDNLTIKARGSYYEDKDAPPVVCIPDPNDRNTVITRPDGSTTRYQVGTFNSLHYSSANCATYINPAAKDTNDYRYGIRTMASAELNLNDFTLSLTGSYQHEDVTRGQTGNYQEPNSLFQDMGNPMYGLDDAFQGSKENSGEFRLTSPQSGRFRYAVGLYYEEVTGTSVGTAYPRNTCLTTCTSTILGSFRVNTAPTFSDTLDVVRDKSIFGSMFYDLTDQVTVSFEGRYQMEYVAQDNNLSGLDLDGDFNSFLPRLTVQFKATDDLQFYAVYSIGNIPGRFNTSEFIGEPGSNTSTDQRFVKEEELKNYEFGMKSDWLDHRLQLNAAVYHMDWDKIQASEQFFRANGDSFSVTTNRGSAKMDGIELDAIFIPAAGWDLRATASYVDSEWVNFCSTNLSALIGRSDRSPPNSCVDVSGKKVDTVAPFRGSVSAGYTAPLAGTQWNWHLRGDYQYAAPMWADEFNYAKSEAMQAANIRLGVENGRLNAEIYCLNCTDNDGPLRLVRSSDYRAGPNASTNQSVVMKLRTPASYGIRIGYDF